MTRSELIESLGLEQTGMTPIQIEAAIKTIFESMLDALEDGRRIEIRGFGSFSLRYRLPRLARNPKTGEQVQTEGKYALHFKPGKELRDKVNASKENTTIQRVTTKSKEVAEEFA